MLDIGGGLGSTVRYMTSNLPYVEGISMDIFDSFARLAEEIDSKECSSSRGKSASVIHCDRCLTTSRFYEYSLNDINHG